MSSSRVSRIELLISGYSNEVLLVPTDIIREIKRYYHTFCIDTFLLCSKNMKMYNISSSKRYRADIKWIGHRITINPQHIASYIQLPKYITHNNAKWNIPNEQLLSNNWCMMFQVGHDSKYPSYASTDEGIIKQIARKASNDTVNLTIMNKQSISGNKCIGGYKFDLPLFPDYHMYAAPSIVYNKSQKMLFAMNIDTDIAKCKNVIDALNLNQTNLKWKRFAMNLTYQRYATSVCMVDNDRFISIVGGMDNTGNNHYETLETAELYALNCKKSIALKNMNKKKSASSSIYHNLYHKIIVAGEKDHHGMEWFDINKDKWVTIMNTLPINLNNMFISNEDPNLVFIAGSCADMLGLGNVQILTEEHELYQIDLREDNIWKPRRLINTQAFSLGFNASDTCVLQL
eukprot:278490_1